METEIKGYSGSGNEVFLISENYLMTLLPSGGIYTTNINDLDKAIIIKRMSLTFIGVIYGELIASNYHALVKQLRENRSYSNQSIQYRENKQRDAPSRE